MVYTTWKSFTQIFQTFICILMFGLQNSLIVLLNLQRRYCICQSLTECFLKFFRWYVLSNDQMMTLLFRKFQAGVWLFYNRFCFYQICYLNSEEAIKGGGRFDKNRCFFTKNKLLYRYFSSFLTTSAEHLFCRTPLGGCFHQLYW